MEDLDKASENYIHINNEQQEKLLGILTEFKDIFDRTIYKWVTVPVYLEINTASKKFNGK